MAGYLSSRPDGVSDIQQSYSGNRLDTHVSEMLDQESVEVQRAVIGILYILKSLPKRVSQEA